MNETNPYEPPRAPAEPPRARGRLFGPWTVAVAVVLAFPLGVIFYVTNAVRAPRGGKALAACVRAVVFLVVLALSRVGVGSVLGDAWGAFAMLVVRVAFAWSLFSDQRRLVEEHVALGGRTFRGWKVITSMALVVFLGAAIWQFLSPAPNRARSRPAAPVTHQ